MIVTTATVWNNEGRKLAITLCAGAFYRTWWFVALRLVVVADCWLCATDGRQSQRAQAMQKAFPQQLIASQENEPARRHPELHDSLPNAWWH